MQEAQDVTRCLVFGASMLFTLLRPDGSEVTS
jgi:hypothetical protein